MQWVVYSAPMPRIRPVPQNRISLKGVPQGTIYHYTTAKTLINIIKSKALYLSHYQDLYDNDSEEITWAVNTYHETIRHLFPPSYNFSALTPEDFYVFCTCLRDNNKYLWDNYASAEVGDHSGVLIGLDAESLYDYYHNKLDVIHMTPMDYDRGKFVRLCQESVAGLNPIALAAPLNPVGNPSQYNAAQREEILNAIPGYNEYRAKRDDALGALTMQKGPNYSSEEEVRIVHWPKVVNQPLKIVQYNSKKKAVLPWVFRNGHLIKEIAFTPTFSLSKAAVKKVLRDNGIWTPLRITSPADFS